MDSLGAPSAENCTRLAALGMPVSCGIRGAHEEDVIVTNYHLGKLLDSRDYLIAMLENEEQEKS